MDTDRKPILDGFGLCISPGARCNMLSDMDRDEFARLFRSWGLVLLRGFAPTIDEFKRFTDDTCHDFMTYRGGASARASVGGDPTVMTVSEPNQTYAVPLHGEMYYMRYRPDILWFLCVRPAEEAGQTTVADGATLRNKLSERALRLFESQRIRYRCTLPDGRWQALFQTHDLDDVAQYCASNDLTMHIDDDGALVTDYFASALTRCKYTGAPVFINNVFAMLQWERVGSKQRIVRMEDGAPIPPDIVEELRRIEAEVTLDVPWRPGDLLIVDNTRFLHGRRAFSDLRREIYVRLCAGLRADAAVAPEAAPEVA